MIFFDGMRCKPDIPIFNFSIITIERYANGVQFIIRKKEQ